MGRYNVEYKGKWAAFSTIIDAFITEFMDKEKYEEWRKEEYGRDNYVPVEEAAIKTMEEATFSIRLNRSHDQALECLRESGLPEDECEKFLYDTEMNYWCPIPTNDGNYECPNCGEIVAKDQEKCIDETCNLEFVWR